MRSRSHSDERLDASLKRRLLAGYTVNENCCWIWKNVGPHGYGTINRGSKFLRTHRASYEVFVGPIAAGLNVLHRCDVPACCNPNHLFLGTQKDNVADMIGKGRDRRVGVRSPQAVLTDDAVRAMRLDTRGADRIAADLGVHRSTVQKIKAGKSWKHVPLDRQSPGEVA